MTKDLDMFEVAKRLAEMAAADGVISAAERQLLKGFAEDNGVDGGRLIRMAYAMAGKVELPEVAQVGPAELKGRQFEDFVVSLCSDKSRFKLLAWRGDKIVGQTYALDNLMPDLHIRHNLNGKDVEYLVECKYRSSWGEDGIDLSSQFLRYRHIAKESGLELFIALGVGGTAANPDEFFVVPGRMVRLDKKIDRARFLKCLCPKDAVGFHKYMEHYFNKRVLKYAL